VTLGGKQRLGRITKTGDPYLRSLLVMGARAVLRRRPHPSHKHQQHATLGECLI
jgi:transposase